MTAMIEEATLLCVCSSTHLCGCGCGEELNPNLRRAHELVAAGATHQRAADLIGVSREFVSGLLRKPPKYIKGHQPKTTWPIRTCGCCGRDFKSAGGKRRFCGAEHCAWVGFIHHISSSGGLITPEDGWVLIAVGKQRIEMQAHDREMEKASKRKRSIERQAERDDAARERLLVWSMQSLDAPVRHSDGFEFTRYSLATSDDTNQVVLDNETASRLHAIVGDMDPDDVLRMTEWDLARLRERLAMEGFAPRGVQQSERERLAPLDRHTNVAKAPLIPGRKTRRQKIEHKAANRNSGNSNRPAQKPRKRWEREL